MLSLPPPPDGLHTQPKLPRLEEEDTQKAIDQLIIQGVEYVRSLKTRRNEYAKIASLLAMILVIEVEPKSDFTRTSWRDHMELTAVCRLWRTLKTPTFWPCIPFDVCKHLPEILARSKSHPLSVRFNQSTKGRHAPHQARTSGSSTIRDCLPVTFDAGRLAEFHLSGNNLPEEWWKQLPQTTDSLLHTLNIQFSYPTSVLIYVLGSAAMPRLRHLELAKAQFDWRKLAGSNTGITNLITLSLDSLTPVPPGMLLWDIITSSPNLEQLMIRSALPENFQPPAIKPAQRIRFPLLWDVNLKATFKTCVSLLLAFGSPKNSYIYLETTDVHTKLEEVNRDDLANFSLPAESSNDQA